ncbi:MAG: hypothetical protein QXF05_05685 [Thermofilaceae archaeon]
MVASCSRHITLYGIDESVLHLESMKGVKLAGWKGSVRIVQGASRVVR